MYPSNFVHPTKKLLLLNKLKKPMEIINIIKSYIFYDINSLNFAIKVASKKENHISKIKSSLKASLIINKTGYWSLYLSETYEEKSYFQGYNCNICGEFTLVNWKNHKNIISGLPICFCSDEEDY